MFRTIPWGLLNPVDGKPKEFYFMYKVKYGATTEYVEFLCREMNKVAEAVLERDTFEKAFPIFLNSCPGHTINPKRHVALGTEPERMITVRPNLPTDYHCTTMSFCSKTITRSSSRPTGRPTLLPSSPDHRLLRTGH